MIGRPWTRADDDTVRAMYQTHSAREISEQIGRTERAVYQRANDLGLRKTRDWIAERTRQAMLDPNHGGRRQQFQPGITPWNKAQNSGQDINHKPAGNCLTTEAMPHLAIPPLVDGETYVGAIGDASGKIHHVILLPGDNAADPWKDQMAWAKSIGGDLPNRIEQAMLFASFKDQFKQVAYWSNQQHASVSGYAWFQGFGYGTQRDTRKDGELRARAVRRLVIE